MSRSTRQQSIVGLHRQSDYIAYHFADDLEDDQITDDEQFDDQITVVLDDHHESDCDSYWDVMFLRQKQSLHPLGRHRRNNTFHCSGDPDDDAQSDSDSGIDADYLNEVDETGTPIIDRVHLHPDYSEDTESGYKASYNTTNSGDTMTTPTVMHSEHTITSDTSYLQGGAYAAVQDMSAPSSVTKYNTLNSSVQSVPRRLSITKESMSNSEVMEITAFDPQDGHSAVNSHHRQQQHRGVAMGSMEMARSASTDSARSEVTMLSMASSFGIKEMDRADFLKRVLAQSRMTAMTAKHRETERKLQETHGLQNLKVIGDNHIAINIGMAKASSCGDAPIPEGDEHDVEDSGSEPSRTRSGHSPLPCMWESVHYLPSTRLRPPPRR